MFLLKWSTELISIHNFNYFQYFSCGFQAQEKNRNLIDKFLHFSCKVLFFFHLEIFHTGNPPHNNIITFKVEKKEENQYFIKKKCSLLIYPSEVEKVRSF